MSLSDLLAPPPPDNAVVRPWEAESLREVASALPIDQQFEESVKHPAPRPKPPDPQPDGPQAILEAARAQAAALLQQAEEQAEQLRRDAIREGLREGAAQAEAACAAECERLREIAEGIRSAFTRHCEAQAPVLAQLAAQAAEALLMEQLSLEPERVATVVGRALEQTLAATQVTVSLHPEDLVLVQQRGTERPAVEWRPDPSLERGGCRIESDQGEVDATLSGRLARFREAMLGPTDSESGSAGAAVGPE